MRDRQFSAYRVLGGAGGGSQASALGHTRLGSSTGRGLPGSGHVGPFGQTTVGITANRLAFFPLVLEETVTISDVWCEVTAAVAGNIVIGAYNAAKSGGLVYPTTRNATYGTVATGTTGIKNVTGLSATLGPGLVALAYNADAAPTLRGMGYFQFNMAQIANSGSTNIASAVVSEYVTSTYSATLPDPFPAGPASYATTAAGSGGTYFPIWVTWTV